MGKWFGIGEEEQNKTDEVVEYHEIPEQQEVGQIAVDILDRWADIVIVAPIAWIELEDIDVSLNNSTLTISGTRMQADMYRKTDVVLKNSECFWGNFTRNIILPENLDFDSIKATMENSLLHITISKLNFSSKQIEVENLDD